MARARELRQRGALITLRMDPIHFVVIAHGRSGSTMLSLALASHPNVAMYLEIFHQDPSGRGRYFRADERRSAVLGRIGVRRNARVYEGGEDPLAFLADAVFYPRRSKRIRAVGFKLLHNFCIAGHARDLLWEGLAATGNLRIICLRRKDLVAAFVSHEVARRTGKWTYFEGSRAAPAPAKPFVADLAAFTLFASEIEANEQMLRSRFKGKNVFELTYEDDLEDSFTSTSRRLQEFLDLPVHPLVTRTRRTPARELPVQVSNLAALRERASLLEKQFASFRPGAGDDPRKVPPPSPQSIS